VSRSSRGALWIALVGTLAACGDSCCTDPLSSTAKTECAPADAACETGEAFRFGQCVDAACEEDADCCPGARCRSDIGLCFPVLLDAEYACDSSADCRDPAQRCLETVIGGRDPLPTCVYETCDGDADCGFGRTCFRDRCVETAPCGGSCPDGTACDVLSSKCVAVPEKADGCDAPCGGLRVIADPDTMTGEACCEVTCACNGLPPLVPTRFGRYSRVTTTPREVLVSAYDAQFGDLVVARHDLDGAFVRLDYVDGVPAGAPVVADVEGPRGGVAEPGPNVGTHTAIAVDASGRARIAYHDEDNRSLKVAIEGERGFTAHVVDLPGEGAPGQGRVGQFTDVAVGADGTIFVTYLAHDVLLAGVEGRASGVKLARSRTATPTSGVDWDLFVVDAASLVDACGGCGGAEACVLNDGAAACLPVAGGCPDCGAGACVTADSAAKCLPPPLPAEPVELPRGRGLHTSVVLDGDGAVVASYDSVAGDLRVARVGAAGASQAFVVDGDGQGGHRSGDVGRFPALWVKDGELAVVYEDFGRHEVRAWRGPAATPGQGGAYAIVDRGASGAGGQRFVGAGAHLARTAGAPVAVYQDATTLDLKMATEAAGVWTPSTLATDGAHGFYADVATRDGKAYVVNVLVALDARGVERSRLGLTVVPLR
jgi:hypothetical protein